MYLGEYANIDAFIDMNSLETSSVEPKMRASEVKAFLEHLEAHEEKPTRPSAPVLMKVKKQESDKWEVAPVVYITPQRGGAWALLTDGVTLSYNEYFMEIKPVEYAPFDENKELEPYIDCWFRRKAEPQIRFKPMGYGEESGTTVLRFDHIWFWRSSLFESFEMNVDGQWVPVGKIKEER